MFLVMTDKYGSFALHRHGEDLVRSTSHCKERTVYRSSPAPLQRAITYCRKNNVGAGLGI